MTSLVAKSRISGFHSFASCDSVYLRKHAPAFLVSCMLTKNNVHVHIINPSQDDLVFMGRLYDVLMFLNKGERFELAYSYEETDLSNLSPEEKRTYYACNRFLRAPDFLTTDLFVTDIDCIFNEKIQKPTEQLGLFFREPIGGTQGWENQGTRIAAGAVYYSVEAAKFAENVAARIQSGPLAWFLDQVAIHETYQKHKNDYTYRTFDSNFMDWEFRKGTVIWTGKGPRKYDNPVYVAAKGKLEKMIWLNSELNNLS